jgi:hypothetical protein
MVIQDYNYQLINENLRTLVHIQSDRKQLKSFLTAPSKLSQVHVTVDILSAIGGFSFKSR